jgi:hypothetical protein
MKFLLPLARSSSCQIRKGIAIAKMQRLAIQVLGIQAGLRFSTAAMSPSLFKSRLC